MVQTITIQTGISNVISDDTNVVLPNPPAFIRLDENGCVSTVWYGKSKTVNELDKKELIELKKNYCSELENEGLLAEILGHGIPWWVDRCVDDAISDDFIRIHYDGVSFNCEDFFCNRI